MIGLQLRDILWADNTIAVQVVKQEAKLLLDLVLLEDPLLHALDVLFHREACWELERVHYDLGLPMVVSLVQVV